MPSDHGLPVKEARIARAGTQIYSREEILARGFTPVKDKMFYTEYRPPEIVIKNLSKFNNVFFVNDHSPVDVTLDNWKDYAIGSTLDHASVEVTEDGEIFIKNKIQFYDRAAFEAYQAGKVELSAGYDCVSKLVDNPDEVGYDLIMVDIDDVNHVALVDAARAGRNARILDSVDIDKLINGGVKPMKGISLFSRLRGEKPKTVELSKTVLDSLTKVAAFDEAALAKGLEGEVIGVMAHISPLGDCADKDMLIATVTDSFKQPKEALEKKDDLAKVLDGLYARCQDADAKAAQEVIDEITGKKEPEEKEEKAADASTASTADASTAPAPDIAKIVDAAVSKFAENIQTTVDASVKKALGLPDNKPAKTEDSVPEDDYDTAFLFQGSFGSGR